MSSISANDESHFAANILWEKLSERVIYEGFSPYPEDDLLEVYGLADEDLDEDIILYILEKAKMRIPLKHEIEAIGVIRTPANIMKLISISHELQ